MKKVSLIILASLLVGILALAGCAKPAGVGKIAVALDLVRGSAGAPKGAVCVLTNQFERGEQVTFRVRLTDLETGDEIPANASELLARATPPTMEEIGAMTGGIAVEVHLSDGQSFPMHFGAHSRDKPADYFWTFGWVIPNDYPTGTIDYWVTADWAAESKTGRGDPFNVFPSKLTIH